MIFRRLLMPGKRLVLCCAIFIFVFFVCMEISHDIYSGAAACAAIAGAIVCLAIAGSERPMLKSVAFFLIFAVLGIITAITAKYVYYYPSLSFLEKYEGKECTVVLRVDKTDSQGDSYANYNCSVLMCEDEKIQSTFGVYPSLRLNCFGGDFADKGDIIRLKAKIEVPEKKTKDDFEEANYLKARHIFMLCDYSGKMQSLVKGEKTFVDGIREKLSQNITRYVGGSTVTDETVISKCMLLGDKTGVTRELKAVFRTAGISHVLSVSGLHLSILFMAFSLLMGLRKRTVRRRFVYAETISCFFAFAYMLLADFTPSIMRAGFMLIFINLYSVFSFYKKRLGIGKADIITDERPAIKEDSMVFDSLSALFCAGVLICIISPYSVYDIGMQLSFMSTLGILVAVSVLRGFEKKIRPVPLRFVFTSFFITFSAVSFTLPICIHNFYELSTVSALSNLLVTPLMTPLLAILLALSLISLLPSFLGINAVCAFLGMICEFLCGLCIKVARFNSGFVFSVIDAEENPALTVVFVIFVLFTVVCMLLDANSMKTLGFFAVVCMYFVYSAVSFMGTVKAYSNTDIGFCTVNKRPYFCVMRKDTRLFFDDSSGIASNSIITKSFGESLYDTNDIYLVIPSADADFDSVYFNIMYFNMTHGVDALLLPSKEMCKDAGADLGEYAEFAEKAADLGIDMEFYTEEFTVEGETFTADISEQHASFRFDKTAVIFGNVYDERYADRASKGCEYCIYFCDKADETVNSGYNSGAALFVSSPLHRNVRGARQIPTRKPALLEGNDR